MSGPRDGGTSSIPVPACLHNDYRALDIHLVSMGKDPECGLNVTQDSRIQHLTVTPTTSQSHMEHQQASVPLDSSLRRAYMQVTGIMNTLIDMQLTKGHLLTNIGRLM